MASPRVSARPRLGSPSNALSPNAVRTCADAAAVTITHRPCSTNSSRYPLSDPSRERRMCALPPPAASAPATAQPSTFHEHRISDLATSNPTPRREPVRFEAVYRVLACDPRHRRLRRELGRLPPDSATCGRAGLHPCRAGLLKACTRGLVG